MNEQTAYRATRARIEDLAASMAAGDALRRVPACPDWTVHDLVAHMVGVAAALTSGHFPAGDLQAWLDALVAQRRDRTIAALIEEWGACAAALDDLIAAGGLGTLVTDVVVHEHDLRSALGRPGERDADEVTFALAQVLGSFTGALTERGLSPIAVRHGDDEWQSHGGQPGWTLLAAPWPAMRALASRRTAVEVHALPAEGDPTPYVEVIAARMPLPSTSLGE